MYTYKTLNNTNISSLHQAFVEAFSDYEVKINLSLSAFELMMRRRGLSPELSVGAFQGEQLVGFVLNGARLWDGRPTVYDLGTGVIPEHRKRGITSEILKQVKALCREKGITCYLLEVLQNNVGAYELYRKQGFEITREFDCYHVKRDRFSSPASPAVSSGHGRVIQHPDCLSGEQWNTAKLFWDYNPSWQNSMDSVLAASGHFSYSMVLSNEKLIGYGILDNDSDGITQIAVAKEYRNMGVGSCILCDLMAHTRGDFPRMLNVDHRDNVMRDWLIKCGFECYIKQYEMMLHLEE